jgi:2-dehydropantoate 2-reductase
MKGQHTFAALEDLSAVAPAGIGVICAQNGVANEPMALRHFRDVYAMCVILPALHLSPGVVVQESSPRPGVLDLGRYPSGVDERAAAIATDLEAATFVSQVEPAIMRNKYRKLVTNLSNAVEALAGAGTRTSDLAHRAEAEAMACFAAAGIDVQTAEEATERRAAAGVGYRFAPGQAAVNRSSSWQSLARGAGSIEADWLNGEIAWLGRLHGVATPVNELLQREANAAARARQEPSSTTIEDLEAAFEIQTAARRR